MADPKAVLAEYGMDVPDGMAVNVVENTDNTVHITMPAPPSGHQDLSDEELSNAAGGGLPAGWLAKGPPVQDTSVLGTWFPMCAD